MIISNGQIIGDLYVSLCISMFFSILFLYLFCVKSVTLNFF